MPRKNRKHRWEIIQKVCREKGSLTIQEARALLDDDREGLIRKDLREISEISPQFVWERGGGEKPSRLRYDPSRDLAPSLRRERNVAEKEKIASVAAKFVRGIDTIFIDGGSTQEIFMRHIISENLVERLEGRIYTTSLDIADLLTEWQQRKDTTGVGGHLIGGSIRPITRNLTGRTGWRGIDRSLLFDVAIIGTPGVDENGILSWYQAEADGKLEAIARSKVVILLADHSKFDQTELNNRFANQGRYYFGRFSGEPSCKGFYLVSDDKLPDKDKKRLEVAGVEVYTHKTPADRIQILPRKGD